MDFVVTSCRTSDATGSASKAFETGLVINSTTSGFYSVINLNFRTHN